MALRIAFKPLLSGAGALIIILSNGCAVREHAYDCINVANKEISDEMVITPTSLRFQSVTYRFREERGALRIYDQSETHQRVEFNAASGRLQTSQSLWQCKRYTLEVDRT